MRLIDADELKELILAERDKIPKKVPCATYELMREKDNQHGNAMRGGIRVALRCMENTPTIEAEPVRHGKWGEAEIVGYNGYHAVYARPCMLCGSYTREHKPPYCSNCGAKMDAKEDSACD